MTTLRTPNLVLRVWRETQGMTRPQMAEALNRTPSARRDNLTCDAKHIARWETGHIRWPTPRYQRALHDLTGHYPSALGFTAGPSTPGHLAPAPPASQPGSTPTDADLDSIGDLADLAAELSARGYTTALDTRPPRLTVGDREASNRGSIITVGPCFCLDEVPFSLRPPMPLAVTADAIDVLMRLAIARQHNRR